MNNSRFFFVLLSAGAAVGIGNIWLYPYLSYKYTGLFFIPYLIALIALGTPLLMLEFSIGQYFKKSIVGIFGSINKRFSGIGWLMAFNAFILMSLYAVILSWHIIYFFVSFGLQWKNHAESYFFDNVVQSSDGFAGFAQFSLPVFIALIMAWVFIFLYIRKGIESMKRAFLITFPIFIFLALLFFGYSLTLDGALSGVYSFLKPKLGNLLDWNVWIGSFSLAAMSIGLSFGAMQAFARKTGNGFVVGNSLILVIFELVTGIAIGFIMFGTLGFLSMKKGIMLENLASSDFSLPFTALAQALPLFYMPTLLSLLFFIFLAIFFIFGTASLAYSITHVLAHKFRTGRSNAAIFTAGLGFLLGLLFIIKPGFYIMDIAFHFIYYNVLIALLLETIAVGWFFDSEKIANHINQYSSLKIGGLWRFFIRYVIPLVLSLLLFLQIKSDYLLNYSNHPLIYVLIFGVGIVVVPIVIAFLMPRRILDR